MRRRQRPPERSAPPLDPFRVLGLPVTSGVAAIEAARRELAKTAHPDAGGTVAGMQRVNAAADAALTLVRAQSTPPAEPIRRGSVTRDHPSFTIEALPAEAFEGLLVVATELGEVIDDDPPYRLDVMLVDPVRGWCRLDVVPDAGACTVGLSVAGDPGSPDPDVDQVRDLWIDCLNRLDWSVLGDSGRASCPPQP